MIRTSVCCLPILTQTTTITVPKSTYKSVSGTLEPVAVEQGETSIDRVEVATASAGVERIQGRQKN